MLDAGEEVIPLVINAMEKTLYSENIYYDRFSIGMFDLLSAITRCNPVAKHNACYVAIMM